MKWEQKQKPAWGDLRRKRKFLFFPLTLLGVTRWLEFATINYLYVCHERLDRDFNSRSTTFYWKAINYNDL